VVVTPVPLSDVARAFDLGDRSHVALVGGGGKSTLLHALGDRAHGRVVLTTTTKMGADQHAGRRVLLDPTDDEVGAAAEAGPVVVWSRLDGHKAGGVDPVRCDAWFRRVDHVIVEADGSRRHPFKAPGPFEPVIPSSATLVISVIGADALGRVILDRCHRPLRVAALAGCRPDMRLEPRMAAAVILHERGAAGSIPPGADLAVAINQVTDTNAVDVGGLIDELLEQRPGLRVVPIARLP
jgi:probable selenium-dependent hydroxylase accessory protein YqeC